MVTALTRFAVLPLALAALGLAGGCDEGELIGPEGGVVVSDDGRLQLEVPAGALSDEVAISIHAIDAVDDLDDEPVGTVRAYAIEPALTQLSLPATVEYQWSHAMDSDSLAREGAVADADVTEVDITDPQLVIERGDQWRAMPDRFVDVDAKVVAASTHYLGIVAVLEP